MPPGPMAVKHSKEKGSGRERGDGEKERERKGLMPVGMGNETVVITKVTSHEGWEESPRHKSPSIVLALLWLLFLQGATVSGPTQSW